MKYFYGIFFSFFISHNLISCSNKLKAGSKNTLQKTKSKEILMTCPSGQNLVQKPNYQKLVNGCGPEGSTLMVLAGKILAPDFQDCCAKHDLCYETCSPNNKDKCDDDFLQCMDDLCINKYSRWFEWFYKIGCRFQGGAMYQAVKQGGSDAFTASQNRSCICQ